MGHNKSEASWRNRGIKDAIQKLPPRVDASGYYYETANPGSERRLNDTLRVIYQTGYQGGKQADRLDVNTSDGGVYSVYLVAQPGGLTRVLDASTLDFLGVGWLKEWDEDGAVYYKAFRPGYNGKPLEGLYAELDDLAWAIVEAHLSAQRERADLDRQVHAQSLLDNIKVKPVDDPERYGGYFKDYVTLHVEGPMLRSILQDALNGYTPSETSRKQIEAILERLYKYGKVTPF